MNSISAIKQLFIYSSLATFIVLSGCATDAGISDDPDLLTDTEEIPERPGIIEERTGKKLEKSF